jgi:hypothetical protein
MPPLKTGNLSDDHRWCARNESMIGRPEQPTISKI